MEYNGLKDLVLSRQATRLFLDKDIKEEDIEKIIELARFTPSACNSQPWKLFYTVEKEKIDKITSCLQDDGKNKFLSNAKGYIVVVEENATLNPGSDKKFDSNHFVKYDVGEITAYITLTAKTLEIDSCVIGWVNMEKLKEVIGLLNNEYCGMVIALGYSGEKLRPKKRKSIEEISKKI